MRAHIVIHSSTHAAVDFSRTSAAHLEHCCVTVLQLLVQGCITLLLLFPGVLKDLHKEENKEELITQTWLQAVDALCARTRVQLLTVMTSSQHPSLTSESPITSSRIPSMPSLVLPSVGWDGPARAPAAGWPRPPLPPLAATGSPADRNGLLAMPANNKALSLSSEKVKRERANQTDHCPKNNLQLD